MYYIETHNAHNQILVFDCKQAARDWLKKATTWSDIKIESNIKEAHKTCQGFYNIFPSDYTTNIVGDFYGGVHE